MSDVQKLDDDALENVSGGYLFYAGQISGADPNKPWEVIDNHNGSVIDRFSNRSDAERRARDFGSEPANTMEINWTQLQQLRGHK